MTADELEDRFPEWLVWQGHSPIGPGRWYAVRREGGLTQQERNAGLVDTVSGDDIAELADMLHRQHEIQTQIASSSKAG